MSFFLVDSDSEFTLELSLTKESELDLRRQLEKLQQGGHSGAISRRLAAEFSRLVPELLDWDIKRPTKAQIAYARSICYRLKIDLPVEAMESRQAMHLFISSRGAWSDPAGETLATDST
ncbi:hypothetical protein CEE61_18360 [Stenotrophomonas maltophilia]|nr:hypothetical protein CEE61_18360 [Stenotrophomonas maltophilia]